MNNTFSVLFYLKKAKAQQKLTLEELRKEKIPIYCRVTVNGEEREISTKFAIERHRWDYMAFKDGKEVVKNDQRVYDNKADAKLINSTLDNIHLKFKSIYHKLEDKEDYLTAELVMNEYLGKISKNRATLLTVFDAHLKDCYERIKNDELAASTVEKRERTRFIIAQFIKDHYNKEDILIEHMNTPGAPEFSFIHFYMNWGKTKEIFDSEGKKEKKKWDHNYCSKQLEITGTALEYGIISGMFTGKNPFYKKVPSKNSKPPKFLDIEDVLAIEDKDFFTDTMIAIKDVFLFACYTGLAYAELKALKPEHISIVLDQKDVNNEHFSKYWIFIGRKKTRKSSTMICKIPLLKKAYEILEKYKDHPGCINQGVVLPVLACNKYNEYLKQVQNICEIKKNLSTHVARHTCSRIFLDNGFSIDFVSKMLGHSSTKLVAKIYGEITTRRMSREIEEVGKQSNVAFN